MSDRVRDSVINRQSPPNPRDHARHDELLVARYAAADAYPGERAKARELVEGCPDCAALATDIQLVSRATAGLPAPRLRRDFRLTPEKAQELRGTFLDRTLRRLAAPGMAAALRPVAGVALSLGIVLAVVGTGLPQAALPAAAPADQPAPAALEGAENYALGATPAADSLAPGAPGEEGDERPPKQRSSAAGGEDDRITTLDADAGLDAAGNPLFYAGVLIALGSLGVLLLIWLAHWRGRDPLLR